MRILHDVCERSYRTYRFWSVGLLSVKEKRDGKRIKKNSIIQVVILLITTSKI